MSGPMRMLLLGVALLAAAPEASARLIGLDIVQRVREHDPTRPNAIPYERILGQARFAVDPQDPANVRIVDLGLAPRNARGAVEFAAEFELVRPIDPARGNGNLLFFAANRGHKLGEGFFSNGLDFNWLQSEGYAYLWCGWGHDVIDDERRLSLHAPIARGRDRSIRGRVLAQIVNYADEPVPSLPLTWGGSIPPSPSPADTAEAALVRRRLPDAPAESMQRDAWCFTGADARNGAPDRLHVFDGLAPGWLYELVYTAQDPPVAGLGLAAIRDIVAFLRHAPTETDTAANPMAGAVARAYAWGHSQSGRLLNHFVWEGFNADENGRRVFDGVLPNCPGAGRGQFNARFAQTTRHGSHLEDQGYPVDVFPFAYEEQRDPVRGVRGHALDRARRSGHPPKLMILNSSTDYWTRGASLIHTDVEGGRDADIDPSVRIYALAGIAHTEGRAGVVGRALLTAMDAWVRHGTQPPASRVPRIEDGTLVDLDTWRDVFPAIPDLSLPTSYYLPPRLDAGPRWMREGIADRVPPLRLEPYAALVPQVDADGNEIAGIRLPEVAVPLATFCGWRLRPPRFSPTLSRNAGRILRFPDDAAQRTERGDPRPSLAERYPCAAEYLRRVEEVLDHLRAERLILPLDHARMLAQAERQHALFGRLRPIPDIFADATTDEAHGFFREIRSAGLEWIYRSAGVGHLINGHGYALMAEGDLETAARAFVVNTRLYPEDGNVWDSLGECRLNQARWDEAEACYRRSLEYAPDNRNAPAMLARIAELRAGPQQARPEESP